MRVLEDGHWYDLDERFGDGVCGIAGTQRIRFVNREPGHEQDGTTTQEVIRALIDRTQYCDKCLPWSGNKEIVAHLRMALALHEARAMVRKVERGALAIERMPTNPSDHHLDMPSPTAPPEYGFERRTDSTETGSLTPGEPCHTPVPDLSEACGELTVMNTACTLKKGHAGAYEDDVPF